MSANILPGTYRPPELRARNADPIEGRASSLTIKMLVTPDWEARAELWRQILAVLAKRPPALIEQLEAERLARARR